jgi:alkanesulfonate monooxygenase SsuD/methylene tetrahydromethanopterin reductase-like flavin-dependent oxidoreductase (luciferase family)
MAIAVAVMPLENRREAVLHLAAGAERLGYDALYLPETWSWDVTVLLGEIAARTERIHLGTGILGVWGRSAAQLAMAAATLHAVSGGRFALGLGASTKQLAEGFHDVAFTAPGTRMRQVVTQVRALLKGERVPLAAMPDARPLRLNLPPAPSLPIHLAGLAQDSVRLAGELADGWLPFLYPRSRLAQGMATLGEGAARTDPPRARPVIHPCLPTVVAASESEARRGAEWFVAFYLTSMGPFYPGVISRLGFEREVAAVIAANTTRGSTVVPPEAEALLDELVVYGTPDQARTRLARWREAGAAMPILLLPANLEPGQMDFALHAFR